MIIVILAGGGGTRLWPVSRLDFPKQFLHFGEPLSFLQKTVLRFHRSQLASHILISTHQEYAQLVQKQLDRIDPRLCDHLVIEPCKKNTAPAIVLSVHYILEQLQASPQEPILILPSDHILDPESQLLEHLQKIEPWIRQGEILTFGIEPTKAETGYGYIQLGEQKSEILYSVQAFIEKPDQKKAEQYLNSGGYLWNAGMFAFHAESFLKALQEYAPVIGSLSKSYRHTIEQYSNMPDLSIDYALMEKLKTLSVSPLKLFWSDVGSWDSIYEMLEKDENQNVKIGNVVDIDTSNSLIMGGKKLISTIGLKDMLIIETDDAIFLAKKGESQKVKKLMEKLRERVLLDLAKNSFDL